MRLVLLLRRGQPMLTYFSYQVEMKRDKVEEKENIGMPPLIIPPTLKNEIRTWPLALIFPLRTQNNWPIIIHRPWITSQMPDSVSPVLSGKDLEFVTAEWFVLPTTKLQDEVKFWISTHYGRLTPSPPYTPRTLAPTLLCSLNSQAKVPRTDPSNEGHRVSSPVSLPLILWEGARGDGILVISVVRRPNQEEYKFYFTQSSPRGKKVIWHPHLTGIRTNFRHSLLIQLLKCFWETMLCAHFSCFLSSLWGSHPH